MAKRPLENKMDQNVEIEAKVQQFLDDHSTPAMRLLLYQHCTATSGPEPFLRFLLDHLVDTARLLQSWGCEEALWRAGLFHSIYGTQAFLSAPVPFSPFPLER